MYRRMFPCGFFRDFFQFIFIFFYVNFSFPNNISIYMIFLFVERNATNIFFYKLLVKCVKDIVCWLRTDCWFIFLKCYLKFF